MSPDTLQTTLQALRKAGSIFGVLFSRQEETLFSDLAYTPERIEELRTILDDIGYYFEQEKRSPDTLAFSYDGGNLLILIRDGLRLVVLHHNADEADFIATAGAAFLKDFFVGKAIEDFSKGHDESSPAPEAPTVPERTVDPTTPITPITS